jgi:hypothetical protein
MLAIHDLRIFGPTSFGVIAALSVVFLLSLTKPLLHYGLQIDFPKHYAATESPALQIQERARHAVPRREKRTAIAIA